MKSGYCFARSAHLLRRPYENVPGGSILPIAKRLQVREKTKSGIDGSRNGWYDLIYNITAAGRSVLFFILQTLKSAAKRHIFFLSAKACAWQESFFFSGYGISGILSDLLFLEQILSFCLKCLSEAAGYPAADQVSFGCSSRKIQCAGEASFRGRIK